MSITTTSIGTVLESPSHDRQPDNKLSQTTFQPRWLRSLRLGAIIAGLGLALLAIATWFPDSWWRLWLIQHLRPQLAIASIVALPALWLLRCRRTALVVTAPLLLNLAVLLPLFFGNSDGEPILTLTHVNVDRDKTEALEYANRIGNDIVFLQEVQPAIESEFGIMSDYEVAISSPEPDTRGSAMLVRKDWKGRVVKAESFQLHSYYRPFIAATVEIDGELITLLSFHAIRPFAKNTIATHQDELDNLARWVARQEHPVIVVGDFNATPWSSAVQPLKDQGLASAMSGQGLQSSWPATMPEPLRIPIDISFHSPELVTVNRSMGENVGSDHLPIHLEFARASDNDSARSANEAD